MITINGINYTGVVIGGVECLDLSEGLEEGIDDRGPYATKKYLCYWTDRYALANAFLGLTTGTGGQSGSVLIRGPQSFPESSNMFAQRIKIEGKGKPTQGTRQLQYPYAVVTADFGVPSWSAIPSPDMSIDPSTPFVYATQKISFGREMKTVPRSAIWLANGHRLTDEKYFAPHPYMVFNITINQVPFLPAQAIAAAMRRPLNETTFLGIAPGYLMLDGCDNDLQAMSDGTQAQSLSYIFRARMLLAWDEVYDPTNGSAQQARVGSSGGFAVLRRSEFRTLIPSNYYS